MTAFLTSAAGTVVGNIVTVALVYAAYWGIPKLLDRLDRDGEELDDPYLTTKARAVHEKEPTR